MGERKRGERKGGEGGKRRGGDRRKVRGRRGRGGGGAEGGKEGKGRGGGRGGREGGGRAEDGGGRGCCKTSNGGTGGRSFMNKHVKTALICMIGKTGHSRERGREGGKWGMEALGGRPRPEGVARQAMEGQVKYRGKVGEALWAFDR